MKIKTLALLLATLAPSVIAAQPDVMNTGADGYLERARLMYESRNYTGCIDQIAHLNTLPASEEQLKQAQLLEALSRFERGEAASVDHLIAFVEEHPTDPQAQMAQMKIGDYYFYRGDWDNAQLSYSLVRPNAQDLDANEDLLYRKAYCNLRQGNYALAEQQYANLTQTRRYGQATVFYKAYIDYAEGHYNEALDRFQHIDPTGELGYQSQYYITQIKYHQGRFNDVIATGGQLLSEQNNDYFNAELSRMVGESYYHKGNEAQARKYLQRYLDSPEGDIYRTAAYTMGVLEYKEQNYGRVIELMPLATDTEDAIAQSAWLYLGQAKLKRDDINGAARAFEQAANMNFDRNTREVALYNYAVSQNKGAKSPFGRSIERLEQFLNEFPNSQYKDQVEGYLSDAYFTSTDYTTALKSINRIKKPGTKVKRAKQYVLYNLGMQSLAQSDNKAAVDYLKQAVDLGNQDKTTYNEARLWLAEALYRTGDYKGASTQQQGYLNATAKTDANYALAQYNLGYSLYQQRRYAEARKAFQNAVDNNLTPELRADAYNRLGDTQYYTQDYTAARQNYDKALTQDGAQKDYSMYQMAMMSGMQKDYAAQITQLDALLRAYPKSELAPQAMLEKGNAQAAAGGAAQAVATYKALAQKYPKSVEARKGLLQMAIVDKNENNEDAAIEAYKQVIKSYPSSEEAHVAAEDMKLIYADRGKLPEFERFLNSVPDGPRVDISEIDRLTFEAAEKAAIAAKPDISKMQAYLTNNPNGAYAAKAQYYIARHNYNQNNLQQALNGFNTALKGNQNASWAEDAMSMRADILMRSGKTAEALKAYQELAENSSSDDNRTTAELGLLRTAAKLKNWTLARNTAATLLQRGGLSAAEEREVTMNRAIAANHLGDRQQAQADLANLARDTKTEEGAQAAYELAQIQFDAGNNKQAEQTIEKLLDSGSPHAYWVARGFILLSDIYAKQGKTSEAREYLQSLKNSYPGKEADITEAINSRLNSLKKSKK